MYTIYHLYRVFLLHLLLEMLLGLAFIAEPTFNPVSQPTTEALKLYACLAALNFNCISYPSSPNSRLAAAPIIFALISSLVR